MQKIIFLSLLCFFYLPLHVLSQNGEVVWTIPNGKTEKMHPVEIVGKDETGIYLLLNEGTFSLRRVLVKYDLNMNYQWDAPLEVKFSKRTSTYVDLMMTKNKIVLFVSDHDKTAKTKKIYATTISKSGIVDPNYIEIQTFKNVISNYDVIVTTRFNKEKSLIGITSFSTNEAKNKLTQIIYMNENFTIQSKEEYEEPAIEGNVVWRVGTKDGNYNFYYAYSTINEDTKEKNIERKSYLMTFNQKTKEKKQFELTIENYQLANYYLAFDTVIGRYLNVFGHYADKKTSALAGTFLFKIDLVNNKINSVSVKPFDKSLRTSVSTITILDENSKSLDNSKNESAFIDYSVKNLLIKDNGDIITINEQRSQTSSGSNFAATTSTPGGYYSVTTNYFKNVLVTTFDSTGNIMQSVVIPKYQKTTQYDGGSIGSFMYKNELYIMYLDNPKNGVTISPNQYIVSDNPGESSLVFIKIDENGNMQKSVVIPASMDKKSILINAAFLKVIDDELFIMGHQEGKYKIGKISLK